MSETHLFVDSEIDRLMATEELEATTAAMRVMITGAMAMASALPSELRGVLTDACSRWFGPGGNQPLAELALECWSFLEAKNRDTTTVVDREDVAVRTLLCVLSDELPDAEDLDMTLDYFVSMIDRFEGAREVLGGAG